MEHHLVSTQWLAENLGDSNIRIVDIRGRVMPAAGPPPHYFAHRAEYETSHIPGAVFVDWTHDIVLPDSPSYDVAEPKAFAKVMSERGIGSDTFVVAYDDAQGMFAARLWWALNYYGHRHVAILDGGWQKWLAEDRLVSHDIPQVVPADFMAQPQQGWRVTADEIVQHLNEWSLLDVRTPQEFAGNSSRARRAGHIPGAMNLSRNLLVDSNGTLLSPEQLKHIFETFEGDNPVFYCNAGVSASFALLARRVAGYGDGRLYDGSWKDWGNDDTKPVATE